MMSGEMISISIPPFPDFIEGNVKIFKEGQYHPNRKNLGYFDLIVVKKGVLYLQEEMKRYTIKENELIVLLPDKHHYSWKPCEQETVFYWIHFYTTAQWKQSDGPSRFISNLPIPDLHYHQHSYTLNLPKHAKIKEPILMFELMQEILDSTIKREYGTYDIWRTEELFLRFLKFVEEQKIHKDRTTLLADEVQLFLENNFNQPITNKMLEEVFHMHSNHIALAIKSTFGKTPLEVLQDIRIERAKQYLLRSDMDIQTISKEVGYNSEVYFSSRFKKITGISPQNYRKKYRDN